MKMYAFACIFKVMTAPCPVMGCKCPHCEEDGFDDGASGGVLDTTVSAGSFHIGFLPTGYWPTFYVAKLRRTVNATSTGTAYFGIFHWQPSTVFI